ncbi:hypothetical protein C0Q98_30665 [Streptomyces albidoflavus]|nr:hypothetical protein C0Q96_29940 [Streptomyces albidoflavus]RZE51527.1 hypothetical protein C0Q98_30665 [Streptomyces albidoflavus]
MTYALAASGVTGPPGRRDRRRRLRRGRSPRRCHEAGRLADRSGDLAHAAFLAVHVLCGAVTCRAYARQAA